MTGVYAGLLIPCDMRVILLRLRWRRQKKAISARMMTPPIEQPAAMPSMAAAPRPLLDEEKSGLFETLPVLALPPPVAVNEPDWDAGPSETRPEFARMAVEAPPTVLPIAVM